MKILAIGDIDNADDLEKLSELDLEQYSCLILTGDMAGLPISWKLGKARGMNDIGFIPQEKKPKEFYNEFLTPCVDKLKTVDSYLNDIKSRIKIFSVYGNTDFKSIVNRVNPKSFTILHKKSIQVEDIYLVGYNGHPMYPWEIENPNKVDIFGYTYAETANELNSFKEDDIFNNLSNLTKNVPSNKTIVVTHTPPYQILDQVKSELIPWAIKSYGDRAKDGNIGSIGLRDFIFKYNPLMSIYGHIHEAQGMKTIGKTCCINTGKFTEDYVDIEIKNGSVNAKFERLRYNAI